MNDLAVEHCRLLDATTVAEALGIPKAKERHKWACPACGSSDGLHIYPGPGRGSYCWACSEHLDSLGLVMRSIGADFMGSVDWLAREFGFADLLEEGADTERARRRQAQIREKIEVARRERARLEAERRQAARAVWDRMWPMMRLGARAVAYLESRGIPHEVAEHVGLRSVETDGAWRELRSEFWPDELDDAGLVGRRDGDTYPVPWRTPFLVIPYWLEDSGLDILRFRDLSGHTPKYLSPLQHKPQTPYLSHAAWACSDDHATLYVCEGELNALSVVFAGGVAIGSCGQGTWQPEWSKEMKYFERVFVLCDGDEPGQEFARRVAKSTAEVLGRDWVASKLRKLAVATGMDANDLLVSGQLEEVVCAA